MFVIVFSEAIADDDVRYQYVKKKGYVRLQTNKGDLNLELHCDKVTVRNAWTGFHTDFFLLCGPKFIRNEIMKTKAENLLYYIKDS